MDRQDFEQVVPELRLKLLKIALFYLTDEEEAEDVVQDTLLKLWMTRSNINDGKAGVRFSEDDDYSPYPSTPMTQEELKPFDDFFQAQYNDSRAIRRQETHTHPSNTNHIWSLMLPGDNFALGDTIKTNVVFSQRPVNDDSEFKELLRMAEQYKGTDKSLVTKIFRDSHTFRGRAVCLHFMDGNDNFITYYAILEDGVFSILKAAAPIDEGINIYYNWWR